MGSDANCMQQNLGMELPSDFSTDMLGSAVGLDKRVHTIDVRTQRPGPRLSLGELSLDSDLIFYSAFGKC